MKIYLATAVMERGSSSIPFLEKSAFESKNTKHQVVDNPKAADVILFVDLHCSPDLLMRPFRHHPLSKQYRNKIFVYDERDNPLCIFPGVYVSMPASRFDKSRQRAYAYPFHMNGLIYDSSQEFSEQKLLFSFIGSKSHKIRGEIFSLEDSRGYIEENTVAMFDVGNQVTADQREQQKRKFVELQQKTKFILCPRGHGTSSIRLYETMSMGRVPVIISDDWVAPSGPDWKSFSLQVAESKIASIPTLLREKEDSAEEMGRLAKIAYQEWFGQEVVFNKIASLCEDIHSSGANLGVNNKWFLDRQFHRSIARQIVGRFYVNGGKIKKLLYISRKFNQVNN